VDMGTATVLKKGHVQDGFGRELMQVYAPPALPPDRAPIAPGTCSAPPDPFELPTTNFKLIIVEADQAEAQSGRQ